MSTADVSFHPDVAVLKELFISEFSRGSESMFSATCPSPSGMLSIPGSYNHDFLDLANANHLLSNISTI